MRPRICFRLATIVNVMITSSDHELHLATCTVAQARRREGAIGRAVKKLYAKAA